MERHFSMGFGEIVLVENISFVASIAFITIASITFICLRIPSIFSVILGLVGIGFVVAVHLIIGWPGYLDECGIIDVLAPKLGVGCAANGVIISYSLIIAGFVGGIFSWLKGKYIFCRSKKGSHSEKMN